MTTLSCRITGGDFDSAGIATRKLKEHLVRIGVDAAALRRAMIASYEAEMNVVIHAGTGTLWARVDGETLDLEVSDEGPGIPNVELALREGWSTASGKAREMGFGAGMGLPNIRRNSDLFEIETRVGRGTRIRSTIRLRPERAPAQSAPSAGAPMPLSREPSRCRACLRCLFACPTGALRVREGGPTVIDARCIGCAQCAAECADGVFGIADPREVPAVAADSVLILPRGFLYGLPARLAPARILGTLQKLGFSEIRFLEEWELALRAETRRRAAEPGSVRPLISPLCPGAVALIEASFPSLIPNLAPLRYPIEAAGEDFPLRRAVLVASCPGQLSVASHATLTERLTVLTPSILGALVLSKLAEEARTAGPGPAAPSFSPSPGELRVSGARHVLKALAEAETGGLDEVKVLELSLCDGGCSGSPFICADPCLAPPAVEREGAFGFGPASAIHRSRPFVRRAGARLDPDMVQAMSKLSRIDELTRTLPGRDCGVCGSPGCGAFAEDIVQGRADIAGCPYASEEDSK
jgi:serine/threonine-protein kinase RsbT